MSDTQHATIDIECGGGGEITHHHLRFSTSDDNPCFSDAEEEGSCYSQFYSTYGGDDPEIGHLSTRISSAASDCSVDVDDEEGKVVILHLEKKKVVARDCRICHLSLVDDGDDDAIELGCCCKDDLAAAHKHCAEAWFKIKGNKTCEICGSIAHNVAGANEAELMEQWNEANDAMSSATAPAGGTSTATSDNRNFWQGHRFLNFLLACMVFAFVISWLFHFNVPS